MSRRTVLLLLAGLVIGAGLGILVLFGINESGSIIGISNTGLLRGASNGPEIDAPAPDFELEMLSGGKVGLEDFRGQVVLINFWATWCGPCRVEMPAIQSRFEQYSPDLVVLAINFDEPAEEVEAYGEELGLTFPILLDPGGRVQRLYKIRGYPSTYIIDENGILQIQHIGLMSEDQLDGYLSQLELVND
ncbi:MAG TPA: TlpA disulfide reductase family protein [Anaerolineales bacterium]